MAKTILVVDDEALIALDIQLQLEPIGHTVLTAVGMAEATELILRNPIDVAIVDWHLRNEVSDPLIDLLKQRHIPFVLCSGSALDELRGLFPATPILSKPFASDDLINVLSQVDKGTIN